MKSDFGADLIVVKSGIRTAVQAKKYSKSVGFDAIKEAVTSKVHYKCTQAIAVTNNYFTAQAKQAAYENQVELSDRDVLIAKLKEALQRKR